MFDPYYWMGVLGVIGVMVCVIAGSTEYGKYFADQLDNDE